MTCDSARTAISALLDDEEPGRPLSEVSAHLAGCPACRSWQRSAHALAHLSSAALARPAQQMPAGVLDAVRPRRPGRRRPGGALRLALAVAALAQLLLALPDLFGTVGLETHHAHELAAITVAVAVGVAAAAARPGLAIGQLPLLATLGAGLVLTALVDISSRQAIALDESGHLVTVGGLVMLWRLAATTGRGATAELTA